jgi:hypothetical protein
MDSGDTFLCIILLCVFFIFGAVWGAYVTIDKPSDDLATIELLSQQIIEMEQRQEAFMDGIDSVIADVYAFADDDQELRSLGEQLYQLEMQFSEQIDNLRQKMIFIHGECFENPWDSDCYGNSTG